MPAPTSAPTVTVRFPGHADPLTAGDKVLLVDRKGRRYLQTLRGGADFHYHRGSVAHDDMIGLPEGSTVHSTKGSRLVVLRPTSADWTVKAPRGAQVVYPKDQALIVAFADVVPGVHVVEAGAGSGALTAALLRAVGPAGRVTSFERREDFAAVARSNVVERFGEAPTTWDLRVGDVVEGLAGLRCDRVVLDLLEPAPVLGPAAEALNPGGVLLAYTPTITQVVRLRQAMDVDARWGHAETSETLLRTWNVDGLSVRPDHRMVAHTAFLTTARRMNPPASPDDGAPPDERAPHDHG